MDVLIKGSSSGSSCPCSNSCTDSDTSEGVKCNLLKWRLMPWRRVFTDGLFLSLILLLCCHNYWIQSRVLNLEEELAVRSNYFFDNDNNNGDSSINLGSSNSRLFTTKSNNILNNVNNLLVHSNTRRSRRDVSTEDQENAIHPATNTNQQCSCPPGTLKK